MKKLYLLWIVALCFACNNSDTTQDEIIPQSNVNQSITTRTSGLSVSFTSNQLTVSWSNPFGCGGPVSILHVRNLDTSEGSTCYPNETTGNHTFYNFKYSGTYFVSASCGCGNHNVSETFFYSPTGEIIPNPQEKCKHDFSKMATYMPNELYLSSGATNITLRFWFSGEFVLGLRPTTYNEFTEREPSAEVYYRIRPTEMSTYSELTFPLPYNTNEFHKYWEMRIYSTECFQSNNLIFKKGQCTHYLSFKFGFNPIVGEWGPDFSNPLKINFTEVKSK